jgi:hypothetical protein
MVSSGSQSSASAPASVAWAAVGQPSLSRFLRRRSGAKQMAKRRHNLNMMHTIFITANNGVESSAPGMPHSQSQNISDEITTTGLRVKRRARSMGVIVSFSRTWIQGRARWV